MDEKNLVCLNDGRYIRVNMNTGKASVLDLGNKIDRQLQRTIGQVKRNHWRPYCDSIGKVTKIVEVWGVIKKGNGDKRPELSCNGGG